MMNPFRFLVLTAALSLTAHAQNVLLEAEQFADTGGWDVDQQFMEQMGSSYLLAHGLGVPVKDAVTTVMFPAPGKYRVWVRTRDWVAPWKAPGAPGKFQLLVNGTPLTETFGTNGAEWHWQDGGSVEVGAEAKIALHDLTGFEGRCDAILFSKNAAFIPPNDLKVLTAFRYAALGLPAQPEDGGTFDLVVVGGGIAGTSAAVSAARNGLTVALVQDRPVLGGNGSSEVRVWPEGHTLQKPFTHIGEIVEEICPPKNGGGNAKGGAVYEDERKMRVVRAEPRIKLFTEHRVNAVNAPGKRIASVTAQNTRTAQRVKISGKLFADCTGDGTVGFLAGADFEMSREDHQGASNLWNVLDVADQKQVLKCECKDKDALALDHPSTARMNATDDDRREKEVKAEAHHPASQTPHSGGAYAKARPQSKVRSSPMLHTQKGLLQNGQFRSATRQKDTERRTRRKNATAGTQAQRRGYCERRALSVKQRKAVVPLLRESSRFLCARYQAIAWVTFLCSLQNN